MILRRLTKSQKSQILEGYRTGESANDLAVKFNCSSNTINRTVKNLISDDEYKLLKGKRSKINKRKDSQFISESINQGEEDLVIPFFFFFDFLDFASLITDLQL